MENVWALPIICVYNLFLGLLYEHLAENVGKSGEEGAFRALSRGYTHWASGRLEQMEVNVEHPEFCHVRCYMRASMKADIYKVYILLGRSEDFATVLTATCECAAGYVVTLCVDTYVCDCDIVRVNVFLYL